MRSSPKSVSTGESELGWVATPSESEQLNRLDCDAPFPPSSPTLLLTKARSLFYLGSSAIVSPNPPAAPLREEIEFDTASTVREHAGSSDSDTIDDGFQDGR